MRLYYLDWLRMIAIYMVVIYHIIDVLNTMNAFDVWTKSNIIQPFVRVATMLGHV